MEGNETQLESIKRDIQEEIGLEISDPRIFKKFTYDNKIDQFLFFKKMDLDVSQIDLQEGKEIRFFSINELDKLDIGFNSREIIQEFLKNKHFL